MKTKYFLFETMATKDIEHNFLHEVSLLSNKVEIFRTGFGEFILSVNASFDEDCETEDATPLDVFHNFRKSIIKLKEYSRKPNPEKSWVGKWELIN